MFQNKNLNLAILFSTAWHLFWMSVIGIVVTPSVQPTEAYQEIGFLGPILEKTAFDLMVEEVKPQAETLYAKSALFLDEVYLRPRGPRRKILKEFAADTPRHRFAFFKNFMKGAREIPLYARKGIRPSRPKAGKKGLPFVVEGPAGEREVIFKPSLLTVSRALYGDAEGYRVKLKFFVSGKGIVYDPKPVVSSGYPEIDLRTMRFLKSWRFSPLRVAGKDKPAVWGTVTIPVRVK